MRQLQECATLKTKSSGIRREHVTAVCHMFPLPWDCYDATGNQITEDTDDIYRARYYDGLNQLTWEDVSDYVLYEDRSISYVVEKPLNDSQSLKEDRDAPFTDIIKVRLMNEDLKVEDQSDGHTTYLYVVFLV